MRIFRIQVLAATATCLFATACTGGAPSPSDDGGGDAEGGGTLRYLVEELEDAEAIDAFEARLADFTEESGIEVELDSLPLEAMRTVLQTQLRSGEGPDVFNWGSGPGLGGALADAGLLYDLTDAYAEHDWPVYDFAVERVTYDGKIYGIPGEMETIGLFYNADLLSDLGVEPPETLDDLTAAAETIRDAGLVPLAVGDQEGWEGGHLLSMALANQIGPDGMEELFAGERPWNSPEVIEALELWRSYNESGFLPESPTSVDYDSSTSLFYSGDAAMIPTGSWLVGEIDDATDFEVGYIPFPGPDGPGIFIGGLGSGPFVAAGTRNPDAAIELLDFLASEEHGRWQVENLHVIPPMPIDTSDLEVSPLFARVLEDISALSEGGELGYNIDVMTDESFYVAMYDGVQAVLTGQATPEQVAANLDAAAQE